MRAGAFVGSGSLVLAGILFCSLACGSGTAEPWPPDPETPWMEVVVDLTAARDGRVPVSLVVSGLSFEKGELKLTGEERGYEIHDLRVTDGVGRPVGYTRRDRRFRLDPVEGRVLKARYEAEPGGQGRWGHQGIILDDWATFDGRLVLMPTGFRRLRAVRIRYLTPDGWQVTTPFRREGDWYHTDTYGPEQAADTLARSCVGLGNFEERTRVYGGMEVRVASYRGWPDSYREMLYTKSFRLLDYFHETLGFDLEAPHVVVWLPTHGNSTVYGGAHSNGNCLDNPDHGLRDWQLLAHRIAHGMNKYPPSGMRIRDHEDEWFKEGWPCFVEIAATYGAGIAEDDAYFNYLYSNYKQNTRTRPDIDIALGEGHTRDGTIHMHYRKAPLAVKMLDELMTARSGRTMAEFMNAMWAKYGWYREPFPLKEELEAFTGVSFEDFWAVVVRERGVMAPVTGEFVTPAMLQPARVTPAVRVDGEPVSGEYLHHLARSGDFESFASIREFVVAEVANRREMAARKIRLFPEEVREHLYVFPPEERYAVARVDAAFREYLERTGAAAGGAGRLPFETEPRQAGGQTFAKLLDAESSIRGAIARPGAEISLWIGDDAAARVGPAPLGFGKDARLLVQVDFPEPPGNFDVDLLSADELTRSWSIEAGTVRQSALFLLEPADRSPRASVVTIRVRSNGKTIARRVFWQQGTEPEPIEILLEDERALREAARRDIEAARTDPSAANLYRKGLSQARLGHYRMAVRAFAEAVELDAANAAKWKEYGASLSAIGEYAKAIEAFDRALELTPRYLQARFQRVLALAGLGRRDEALAALDALVGNMSDTPMTLMWKGQALMALGDHATALPLNQRVVELSPNRVRGWSDLGGTLLALGRHEESLEAYDRALELDPANRPAVAKRAEAFEALLYRGSPAADTETDKPETRVREERP